MKTCFVFPGQGSQYPGMGKDLYESSNKVKELFKVASDSTGMDLQKLLFEGTEEDLKQTDKTQIAVTLVNMASALVLEEKGIKADLVAGHSLGEFAALAYAGVISKEDLFPLVKARGELMAKAASELDRSAGDPGMAAVISRDMAPVMEAVKSANVDGLYVANYNSPGQVVLAGTAAGIEAGEALCKDAGARRYIVLKVSGPFHSPLMQAAADAFKEKLEAVEFQDPKLPVYSNVTGELITSGAEAKKFAVEQIVSSVLWTKEEEAFAASGVERIIEAGPGTVLAGLWKAFNSDIPCFGAGTLEQIENISQE